MKPTRPSLDNLSYQRKRQPYEVQQARGSFVMQANQEFSFDMNVTANYNLPVPMDAQRFQQPSTLSIPDDEGDPNIYASRIKRDYNRGQLNLAQQVRKQRRQFNITRCLPPKSEAELDYEAHVHTLFPTTE